MPLVLCVLLWAVPGREELLGQYEDAVLDLLPQYRGRVVSRVRNTETNVSPTEVQILELPSQEVLELFMLNPIRLSLGPLREQSVARTEIIRVAHVT